MTIRTGALRGERPGSFPGAGRAGSPVKHPMPPPQFEWLGGVPVIAGSLVRLATRIVDRHLVGDHTLVWRRTGE